MTVLNKPRTLSLALVLSMLAMTSFPAPGTFPDELPSADEVVGSLPYPALACAGCIAGGVFVSLGGWASVLAAAARPGSVLALAGCAYACRLAVVR